MSTAQKGRSDLKLASLRRDRELVALGPRARRSRSSTATPNWPTTRCSRDELDLLFTDEDEDFLARRADDLDAERRRRPASWPDGFVCANHRDRAGSVRRVRRVEKAERIGQILDEIYPETPIPLDHTDPYTLLVAVALSAQTTDKKVNQVTPALFAGRRHAREDGGARPGSASSS